MGAGITTGPIAKDIATRFHLDRRKTASILDTFSCFTQGIIPYGAQMLMAAGLASISPISIIGNLYYPFTMGSFALLDYSVIRSGTHKTTCITRHGFIESF